MSAPIHILSYRAQKNSFALFVDRQPLLDLLESAIPVNAECSQWREKNDALLLPERLQESFSRQGEMSFYTCRVCGISEDIALRPFLITQRDDAVCWEVSPPGQGVYYEDTKKLYFNFHRPQYEKCISALCLELPIKE